MTAVKVKIDISAGLIELEGESEFVGTYLDKLLPIIEGTGFGNGYRDSPEESAQNNGANEVDSPQQNGTDATKKKRRVSRRPPAGASCRDRILILKGDGFFKEHRSPTDIVAGLGKKGWTHKTNQVSAALTTMFANGEIQRTKAADGTGFDYYWDRH